MAVVVFDADVLIAYLARADAHHDQAVKRMRQAVEPGMRRIVSAVNYTELLIGPLRRLGPSGARTVDEMLAHLGIETLAIDGRLARSAARVRAETRLTLPDAYAVATALSAAGGHAEPVHLESFDEQVVKTHQSLAEVGGVDLR